MATYYISPNGLDANNGLGPDASHATNKPWLTLSKALASGTPVVPGDTIYVGPGIYYSTAVTVTTGIASTASPTVVQGDPLNAQGFKDASGVRLATGPAWFTNRTLAEGLDAAPASSTTLISASTAGTNGVQFKKLVLAANPNATVLQLSPATCADWLLESCILFGLVAINFNNNAPTAARNLTVRGCEILCGSLLNSGIATAAATADADLVILFEGNWIFGRISIGNISFGTSAGNKAGGIRFKGNTFIGQGASANMLSTGVSLVSTVMPIRFQGNLILGATWIVAGTAGQVVSDGNNRILTYNAETNFTPDATDIRDFAPVFNWQLLKEWGSADPAAPLWSWGPQAVSSQKWNGWNTGGNEFKLRLARPHGPGASIGALEKGQYDQDTTSAITGGGANSLKITGAGEVSLFVPVDAVATTITIVTKSTGYGGTNWPQLIMEASPAVGVTATTATGTSAAEQTLTISSFSPTAAGVVELRLISRSSSTTSSTFFDLLAAS